MSTTELNRSTLQSKDKDELHQIANAMGAKPGSRARKAEIVDLILDLAGGSAPSNGDAVHRARRRPPPMRRRPARRPWMLRPRPTRSRRLAPSHGGPHAELFVRPDGRRPRRGRPQAGSRGQRARTVERIVHRCTGAGWRRRRRRRDGSSPTATSTGTSRDDGSRSAASQAKGGDQAKGTMVMARPRAVIRPRNRW